MKLRFLPLLCVALLLLCVLPLSGCTDAVGSRLTQDIGTVAAGNASPHTATQVDGEGSWSATGPAGIAQTTIEDGKINVQTTNTSSEFVAPFAGIPVTIRSGKDVVISADNLKLADGTEVKKLSISTSASKPTAALVELTQALVPLWTAMSADQKAQVIESVNAISAGVGDAVAKMVDAAVTLGGVP